LPSKKILVIDDEEKIRKTLSIHLVKAGYEVITASNGFEALRDLDRLNPDLVITDIVMPKVSGLEFGQALRNKTETRGIPFIIISAHSEPELVARARELGASKFLAKPFGIKTLLDSIRKILAH
jgi:DNA-binding response OmpR family regulator